MIPEVIDFRITSMCNMGCPFCFGTKIDKKVTCEKLVSFFRDFKEKGAKYVVITGGEPTLRKDFSQIVMMLKQMGYGVALSTNGTFLENDEIWNLVLKNCDWIAFPVESSIEEIHNHMRKFPVNHFKLVNTILSEIYYKAPDIKVKIGTVITKENIGSVEEILNRLPIEPDSWKLFQLSHTKYNYDYYKKYRIGDDEFGDLIQTVKHKYKHKKTRICYSYEIERNGRYLFLEPNGEVMVIDDGKEQIIGTYNDSREELMTKIEQFVNINKTNSNFHDSFFHK